MTYAGPVESLAFSPDSRHIASPWDDQTVAIWDVDQGAQKLASVQGHLGDITSCGWSPDGTLIASGDRDTIVMLWDARTLGLLHDLESSPKKDPVLFVGFSPDGRWLVSLGRNHCCVWNISAGTVHKSLLKEEASEYYSAAFNAQSTHLATGNGSGTIQIWDLKTGESLVSKHRHAAAAVNVTFSPDGTLVLSASSDNTAKIWDTSGAMVMSLDGHISAVNAVYFSPCGQYAASASDDSSVRLWRTDDGVCARIFSEHKHRVTHVVFSPDAQTICSGGSDGTVVVRRVEVTFE